MNPSAPAPGQVTEQAFVQQVGGVDSSRGRKMRIGKVGEDERIASIRLRERSAFFHR